MTELPGTQVLPLRGPLPLPVASLPKLDVRSKSASSRLHLSTVSQARRNVDMIADVPPAGDVDIEIGGGPPVVFEQEVQCDGAGDDRRR